MKQKLLITGFLLVGILSYAQVKLANMKITGNLSLTASVACAILGGSSGCPCGSETPCLQTYISTLTTQLNLIKTDYTGHTTPHLNNIVVGFSTAAVSFRNSDVPGCNATHNCIFSTAASNTVSIGLNNFFDYGLKNSGANTIVYNFDPLYATTASEYTGTCVASRPTWMTYQMSQDVLFLTHVKNAGFTIWLSASPIPSFTTACGLTLGSVTAAQYQAQLTPLVAAYVSHLKNNGISVDLFLVVHEPNGENQIATQNASPFSTTEFTGFINNGCAAIHPIDASVRCGGGFTAGDSTYSSNYIANKTSNDSVWAGETYGTYNNYHANLVTLTGSCASAVSAGLTCESTEGNPPTWGSSTSESDAYAGCTWPSWYSYIRMPNWADIVSHYLTFRGFNSFVLFGTQIFAIYDSVQSDNCFSSSAGNTSYYAMTASTGSTTTMTAFNTAVSW